jgi:hypothetical protein
MVGLFHLFLLDDNQTASKEFGQMAFARCIPNSFVDTHSFLHK